MKRAGDSGNVPEIPAILLYLCRRFRQMTEIIERRFGGFTASIRLNGCEVCGWLWPSPADRMPAKCSHCDRRNWNTGPQAKAAKATASDPVKLDVIGVQASGPPASSRGKITTETRPARSNRGAMPADLKPSDQLRWIREHSR